jgi:hypothetical protein
MRQEQIDAVLGRLHSWPRARQEDAVQLLLAMEAEGTSTFVLSDAERAELQAAFEAADRGETATDSEVDAVFASHRA